MPQSQTTDQPTAPRGRDVEHGQPHDNHNKLKESSQLSFLQQDENPYILNFVVNPFMPNGFSYVYQLDQSIKVLRGVGFDFFLFLLKF